MARAAGGVFCIEGQWDDDLTKQGSVLPTLELLDRLGRIRFVHRDAATPAELHHYLEAWLTRRYAAFKVGFLAMHGNPSQLCLSSKQTVEIDEVAGWLSGGCTGKKLYFGACSILRAGNGTLQDFLHETGATMLCGYTKTIDWIESAALETLVLDTLVNGGRVDSLERLMRSARWQALADHLGFRVIYAS